MKIQTDKISDGSQQINSMKLAGVTDLHHTFGALIVIVLHPEYTVVASFVSSVPTTVDLSKSVACATSMVAFSFLSFLDFLDLRGSCLST